MGIGWKFKTLPAAESKIWNHKLKKKVLWPFPSLPPKNALKRSSKPSCPCFSFVVIRWVFLMIFKEIPWIHLSSCKQAAGRRQGKKGSKQTWWSTCQYSYTFLANILTLFWTIFIYYIVWEVPANMLLADILTLLWAIFIDYLFWTNICKKN